MDCCATVSKCLYGLLRLCFLVFDVESCAVVFLSVSLDSYLFFLVIP